MIMLSPQIEKTQRVLRKITQQSQSSLILENQLAIMEKLKELYNMLDALKK